MKYTIALALILSLILLSQSQPSSEPLDVDSPEDGAQPSQQDIQRFYSMRRTACIVLSRHFINSRKDDVEAVFSELSQDQQPQFANKLYSTGVEICEEHIAPNQVQELFVQNDQFDPSVYFPLFITLDLVGISKGSFKLTKAQQHIVQSIKQFDDDMAIRKEEQESEEAKSDGDRGDIKIFNISTKDIGPVGKTVYALIFVSLVVGLIIWVFKQLGQGEPKKKEKKRKEASPPKRA